MTNRHILAWSNRLIWEADYGEPAAAWSPPNTQDAIQTPLSITVQFEKRYKGQIAIPLCLAQTVWVCRCSVNNVVSERNLAFDSSESRVQTHARRTGLLSLTTDPSCNSHECRRSCQVAVESILPKVQIALASVRRQTSRVRLQVHDHMSFRVHQ